MRIVTAVVVLCLVRPAVSLAAEPSHAAETVAASTQGHSAGIRGLGYGVAGLAGVSGFFGSWASSVDVAGGGELLFGGRAGIGSEFGVFANSGSMLFVFSANGVLHLSGTTAKERASPFVTGGYTAMGSGEGSFNAWNVGGGVDLWLKDHFGFRIDARDHVRPDSRGTVQYWTIRGGVVFR